MVQRGARERVREWLSSRGIFPARKYCHLGRRSAAHIFRPNRLKADSITEASRYRISPMFELGARPLEAVVAVTKLPGRECLKQRVVLGVGSRDDRIRRPRELEDHSLKGRESRGIQVFNHLDDRSSIETAN